MALLTDSETATEINAAGSPFDSYVLFSFGYIVCGKSILQNHMLTSIDFRSHGPSSVDDESR